VADDVRPRGRDKPDRIGRYRITSHVGRGAMGVVYAAYDDAMGRSVAVKVLMSDLEHDPETRTRFNREAQAAAGLLHPNIITIYDAGEDRGRPFIAMQLLEGWPLAQYLVQPEAATVERKLDLMVQMCEGLTAAHEKRIIHRDLKPGNLFVQSDGLLKILDFGVPRCV
jgi:serine/threonine protein kinase